jgi:hypothetical protein
VKEIIKMYRMRLMIILIIIVVAVVVVALDPAFPKSEA